MAAPPKRARKDLSRADKLGILDELRETPAVPRATIAERHGISQATLSRIWKSREALDAERDQPDGLQRKRDRALEFPRTDKAILKWFRQ